MSHFYQRGLATSSERKMKAGTFIMLCVFIKALSSAAYAGEWKASVVKNMDALVSSCVVVPCSFTHPEETLPSSRLRGKWHRDKDQDKLVYYDDSSMVLENFRGRTRMLGLLGNNNCSLEITEIKDHDNGPFCFRIELARTETDKDTKDKFSFVEDCVTLNMLNEPKKPSLIHKQATEGYPFTITCSVLHTCPSHSPKIEWSRGSPEEKTEYYREIQTGVWEITSMLTFIPQIEDDHNEITCEAKFHGAKTSSSKMTLYVKRSVNYNHIIIPVTVAIASVAIVGGICFLMLKKYKRRIAEMQNQDGTMWNRLSRLSRRIRSPRDNRFGQRQDDNYESYSGK